MALHEFTLAQPALLTEASILHMFTKHSEEQIHFQSRN